MSIPFPGHSSPAASFELPLEMLHACHERVQSQCALLLRLLDHVPLHGADAQARDAASAVLRYFDLAAPNHHADEEDDLFPALIESMAGSDAVCIREMTDALCRDHRELERRWQPLRHWLQALAAGRVEPVEVEAARAFVDAYERHIRREESELFPMAQRLLGEDELARIGESMQRRRRSV